MIWQEVNTDTVLAAMPTDLRALYEDWITAHADKADRLSVITANTIREFRDAIKSNPANTWDARETWLPQSAIRHVESIIFFSLSMEMGIDMTTSGNSARTAADVFLRSIPYGRWNTDADESGAQPSPHFTVPPRSDSSARALPVIAALILLAATALGGWIKPDSTITDWRVLPTYTPANYTNTTTTLFGHLQGIDKSLVDAHARFVDITGDTINGPLTVSNVWMYVTWGPYMNAISYNGFRFTHPGLGTVGYDISSGATLWRYTYDPAFQTKTYQGRVWDAGNDGAGSGLDADKLDGLESTDFARSMPATGKFWITTNSYLSAEGTMGELWFITLNPPSSTRIAP